MANQSQKSAKDNSTNTTTGTTASNTKSASETNSASNTNRPKSEINDPYVQARQKTGEVIDQVEEKAGDIVDEIKHQATSQLDSQKARVAEGLNSVAQMVKMGSDQLRNNHQPEIAQMTDQAARTLENTSTFLREKGLNDIVSEVENFARREPVLFLGGAFTIGLLASRFLKSSNQSRQGQQNSNALARRTGNNWSDRTHAPLTPAPVRNRRENYEGYESATPLDAKSSVARHFGEDNASQTAQSRYVNPVGGQTDTSSREAY